MLGGVKDNDCPQFPTTKLQTWLPTNSSLSPSPPHPPFPSSSSSSFSSLWHLLSSPISKALSFCLKSHTFSCSALLFSSSQLQSTSCVSSQLELRSRFRKMNGYYSKMRAGGSSTHKSRSVDFSDFPSAIESPRTEDIPKQSAKLSGGGVRDSGSAAEKPETGGERFGMVLSRSGSVASKRFSRGLEKQSIGAQCSAVKKAFSMRRSSSVSERYSRIHDQSVTQMVDYREEEEEGGLADVTGSMQKNNNRGGKIFKACKRLFGL